MNATLDLDKACSCAESDIDQANYKTLLEECDKKTLNDANIAAKATKKKCTNAFGDCKNARYDAVDAVSTCKKVNKCGGVKNKTEAERLLKLLRP